MKGLKGFNAKYRFLTLLHSERPKLYTILAFLSVKGGGGGVGGLCLVNLQELALSDV